MKLFLRIVLKIILIIILIIGGIILYRAIDSNNSPDLRSWHKILPSPEPLLNKNIKSIDDFIKIDNKYVRDNYDKVKSDTLALYQRYNPHSSMSSFIDKDNLNASFVLDPGEDSTKGVILLTHGLSDSPFYMRNLAHYFYSKGFYVFALRLPGHGTLPSGLLDVKWQDWYKAEKWAAEKIADVAKERNKGIFFMGGFSTGGALTLHYIYDVVNHPKLPMPQKIFLFAPAIGVDNMAFVADWHKSLSWLPYFKKFAWIDIIPEIDPAKYSSFTKNAGKQIYLLCHENKKEVKKIVKEKRKNTLPAIFAVDSWVDATVNAKDLVRLLQQIGTSKDELILYDINRRYQQFAKKNIASHSPFEIKFSASNSPKYYVISNRKDSLGRVLDTVGVFVAGLGIQGKNIYPGINYFWPAKYYAISHISIPIAPSNKMYGRNSTLGKLQIHGENNVLVLTANDIDRVRFNPFYNLMTKELNDFL